MHPPTKENRVLGARLQSIFEVLDSVQGLYRNISGQGCYQIIWDCCCDHGYLGMHILREAFCEKLHFVDQLPHITRQIRTKLSMFSSEKFAVITGDAARLWFDPSKQHLVILAGISGRTVIRIMQGIQQHNPDGQIDFLLCPNDALYEVREYLRLCQLWMAHETIVFEKNRFYEVIYLRTNMADEKKERVSLTGNMWDMNNLQHLRYLAKLIAHQQRVIDGQGDLRARKILSSYHRIMGLS